MSDVPAGIDPVPVTAWLEAHVGLEGPFAFSRIAGGHSNITYRGEDATGAAFVLRRPPLGEVLATAHDMAREHRVISAFVPTPVPVPETLGLCEDPSVNGAPFYVMSYVEGTVLHDATIAASAFPDESRRHDLGMHVAAVLADLHLADPDEIGLGDLGRREDYAGRQLRRWKRQWDAHHQRDISDMDVVFDRLVASVPAQRHSTVVHGDYRLGNMLADPGGRVVGVLDWELCTLGDPLADLGYLLNTWSSTDEPGVEGVGESPTAIGGFPSRDALIESYASATGYDVDGVEWYRAFQYWRLAAIVEGVYARYVLGAMPSVPDDLEDLGARVFALASMARDLLEER